MMDFTEKELCVLCERGGKLLVCNDNGCPISVHRECMGCSPRFDETGSFCCPYCVYRRLTLETRQLRDQAMIAKKTLSSFLSDYAQCQSKSSSSPCEIKLDTSVSEETDRNPKRNGEFSGVCDGNTCRIMVVYGGDTCKDQGMNTDGIESSDCKGVPVEKQSTGFNAKPPLLKLSGKRRKWSEEEEDMLKEGVEKLSSTRNKNLPWKKVLAFGRHVFDASRTPSDLKDKWRNMSK